MSTVWTRGVSLSKFLSSETPSDGVVSGKKNIKPSKSSLPFFTTLVNNYRTKILIDTGATATFINEKIVKHLKSYKVIHTNPHSFVLADGNAPFQILGKIRLSILFDQIPTLVDVYIAKNLCTNIILGMDYINNYNLNLNVQNQTISIDHEHHIATLPLDSDNRTKSTPVISSTAILTSFHSSNRELHKPLSSTQIPSLLSRINSYHSSSSHFHSKSAKTYCHSHKAFSPTSPSLFHRTTNHNRVRSFSYQSNFNSSVGKPESNKLYGPVGYTDEATASDNLYPHSNDIVSRDLLHDTQTHTSSYTRNFCPSHSLYCNSVQPLQLSLESQLTTLVKSIHEEKHKNQLVNLITRFATIFDTTKHNIAKTSIHHVIHTIPHSPPACRPYPQPDKEMDMYKLVQEFLQAGLISESHSPYAAPAILVKKKDGTYRFVVDYKKLNLITIKDSSPLPNMEDALRKIGHGYTHFSKLDLKSGFYQIPIRESDKEKTAFVTPFGLYQFNVLPMGLKNSPPTFQKVMSDTLEGCRNFSLVYLDDIIVFSKSWEEHLTHLESVLSALQRKNLVLNPPKCVFATNQIDYLGHTITRTTITPMREKIDAILQIKEPKTLPQANKFLGALGWYRKFIPHFATVAAPLCTVTNLTKNQRHKFKWQPAQSQAFHALKDMLVSQPLFLHYPVDDVPLMLTTDASGIGIGGVLQQVVDGEVRNLYYHSQLMTPCERKYSTIEKEALAIYKCFARMRTLLLGRRIIIRTDHCPLCHIMEKTVHNARVDRITHLIQEYNIEQVIHIKGRDNCLPDFLSRYSKDSDDDLMEVDYGLESKSVPPTTKTSPRRPTSSQNKTNQELLASMVLRPRKKSKDLVKFDNTSRTHSTHNGGSCLPSDPDDSSPINRHSNFSQNVFDQSKLEDEQKKDSEIQTIVKQLKNGLHTLPFVLKHNIVYRKLKSPHHCKRKLDVVYVPSSMVSSLLQSCHDDPMTGAHFSFDRMYHKIKSHYWWPNMILNIKHYVHACLLCKQYNASRHKSFGHLNPITPPDGPFSLIGIDYCGPFKKTPRENQYVLVLTDYFSRHVTAIALPNCTAQTTAEAMFNDYFCKYGVPSVILSDQGPHFRNQLMDNITRLIGYNHIYSSPYHPQSNGLVERFNATFVPQISKLQDTQHNNWDEYLQAVVFAYNTGIHKTTRYSPYELLYGRPARLPIHVRPQHFSFNRPNDYFEQLQKTLRIYHQTAKQYLNTQQQYTKVLYNQNRSDPQYKVGDKVLVRIPGVRGKLDPHYFPVPKIITHAHHPSYEVQDEQTNILSRVHVSNLRPILVI